MCERYIDENALSKEDEKNLGYISMQGRQYQCSDHNVGIFGGLYDSDYQDSFFTNEDWNF
jgi:hypothetical protein